MGPVGAVVHFLAVALSGLTDSKSCIQADGIDGRSMKTGKHPAHDASSVNAQMHVGDGGDGAGSYGELFHAVPLQSFSVVVCATVLCFGLAGQTVFVLALHVSHSVDMRCVLVQSQNGVLVCRPQSVTCAQSNWACVAHDDVMFVDVCRIDTDGNFVS